MTTRRIARCILVLVVSLLALTPHAGHPATITAASLTFTVNSTIDAPDANPGDGICADAAGQCTLRAATQEADAQPSGSSISIKVPAGTYGLTLGTLLLTANTITISGALSSTTVISGNNTSSIMAISHTVQARISQLTITGGNAGAGNGGGLVNLGRTLLSQSTVISNTTYNGSGGGIANGKGGRLWLAGSTLRGNTAPSSRGGTGGGLWNSGTAIVTTSTLSDNATFLQGGGIYNSGALTVTGSTLRGNAASFADGGGIYNGGTLSVTSSTFSRNLSGSYGGGGGIATVGTAIVTGSTLSSNSIGGFFSGGGGIDNSGTLTVTNSTLSGNSSVPVVGGGIYNSGTLSVANSTLSRNSALGNGGGGIYNLSNMAMLSHDTIASDSTGINSSSGTVVLTGTIIANSTHGANCSGSLTDHGYNLDSGTSCGFSQTTDLTNTNPLLGPLANNGGPTQTMALLRGSPAIDHGGTHATGCPATDQRGLPRPDEAADIGACDMGAYESQGIG